MEESEPKEDFVVVEAWVDLDLVSLGVHLCWERCYPYYHKNQFKVVVGVCFLVMEVPQTTQQEEVEE